MWKIINNSEEFAQVDLFFPGILGIQKTGFIRGLSIGK
jgi:hypothetical protein